MKNWIKKDIPREQLLELHRKYNLDALTASVLCRRGITDGKDLLWYIEDDKRFLHSPFEFSQMEDAVDRILAAKEEREKVLIFGDRDVDGITATTVLYQQLVRMGLDVRYRLPGGDDAYGLSMAAVDEFAADYGTLLITVDCGITNNNEIRHAADLGISVIVTDHHEAPELLPEAEIILNPKCADSGYPFDGISGCAVAYKLCEALRFSQSPAYKQQICLLDAREEDGGIVIEAVKLRNLVQRRTYSRTFGAGESVQESGLIEFLRGEQLFCWDKNSVQGALKAAFGSGVEFNLFDVRPEAAKIIPSVEKADLDKIRTLSKIARYENGSSRIQGLFNIFVTYINIKNASAFPKNKDADDRDLQLVMLAALSDIMPLKNENRIFVRRGLECINSGRPRAGLTELLARLGLLGKKIGAHDLGWNVIPVLNAAGRMGTPELSLQLFLEENADERDNLAEKIISLNEERKNLEAAAIEFLGKRPEASVEKFGGKFCLVYEEKFNRGVLGRVAAKLVQRTNVPSIALTKIGGVYTGSMRSVRGLHCKDFLDKFGEIYINHGGHSGAAGFSLSEESHALFMERLPEILKEVKLEENKDDVMIDAELSPQYLTADLMKLIDQFEPYGNENAELVFMTKNVRIVQAQIIGKSERTSLKLWLQIGNYRWPSLWWFESGRLGKDFNVGDLIDLCYNFQRNTFNGHEERQLIIVDARRSS